MDPTPRVPASPLLLLLLACAGCAGSAVASDAAGGEEAGRPRDDGATISLDASAPVGDDASAVPDDGGGGPPGHDARADDAAPHGVDRSVRVEGGPTDNPELVQRLPIGTSASGAERRVVLRLDPADLPSLREGDVLMTPAEVEVTTACDVGQTGPSCGYSPNVAAQIILTGDREDRDPSGAGSHALSEVLSASVTSAEHHNVLVFTAASTRTELRGALALPCLADQSCHVNLVMWAWDPSARPGGADALLVGENEGDYLQNGVVQGDKARLMAIRERGITDADRVQRETSGGGSIAMPLDARGVLIYSQQLAGEGGSLAAGEQFYVEARVEARVTDRARFSTQMFLTHDPRATDPQALDGITPRSISEHNGGNCTAGTSPCTTRKVAVFRAADAVRGPVYVQLIARSEVPGGGPATVTVDRGAGSLRTTRYAADLQ